MEYIVEWYWDSLAKVMYDMYISLGKAVSGEDRQAILEYDMDTITQATKENLEVTNETL